MQQDGKLEAQRTVRRNLRRIKEELVIMASDIATGSDRSTKYKNLPRRIGSFVRLVDEIGLDTMEQAISSFVNLLSDYFMLMDKSASGKEKSFFELVLMAVGHLIIKYSAEHILRLPLKLNFLILTNMSYRYSDRELLGLKEAIQNGESLVKFATFHVYAMNCVQQIALNYEEFLELIKDNHYRRVCWDALKHYLTPEMMIALCQYHDVREYLINLIINKKNNKSVHLNFLRKAPEVVALYHDINHLKLMVKPFELFEPRNDTEKFMPHLLKNDVFVDSIVVAFPSFINRWSNMFNNYLQSLINDPVRREHDSVKVILPILLKNIDRLNDFSTVFHYEMLLYKKSTSFFALVRARNMSLRVVDQVFDDYFFQRNATPRDTVLSLMKVFSHPKDNPDPISRARANYYAAKIHMEKQEFTEANLHMMTLGDGENALSEDEHAEIAMYLVIAKSPDDQQRHIVEMGKHRNYLDETEQVMQNSYVKDKFTQTLDQLQLDLTKYLNQRNTNSFLYKLGIKNLQLSNAKNQLVSNIIRFIDVAKASLTNSTTSQEILDIAKKLASQAAYAVDLNGSYYRQYGRVIDGPGTLGGQLAEAKRALDVFAGMVVNQTPDNVLVSV